MQSLLRFSFLIIAIHGFAWSKPVFEYCKELQIAKPLKVNIPAKESKTTVQFTYTIVRSDQSTFDVYLNPKFVAASKYDSHYPEKEEVPTYFKKKMQACFDDLNNMLSDEKDRKVRLHVFDKKSDRIPAPPVITINVQTDTRRSNSANFSSEINCNFLLHETFHYLGLVDEYEERSLGYNPLTYKSDDDQLVPVSDKVLPAYDCRALGGEFSLMRDPTILGIGQNLFSGHLNAIIYPNCVARNFRYLSCAEFAYRTSAKNKGLQSSSDDCAVRIPDYCKKDGWMKED